MPSNVVAAHPTLRTGFLPHPSYRSVSFLQGTSQNNDNKEFSCRLFHIIFQGMTRLVSPQYYLLKFQQSPYELTAQITRYISIPKIHFDRRMVIALVPFRCRNVL